MSTMFGGTPSGLTGVTNLDAFATKTINETWYGGTSYTAWNMSRVSSLSQFAYASGGGPISRNYNIASWQISSALTNMYYIFGGKTGGNGSVWQQDVGHWNVSGLDDGPSKISYWLSARNGQSPPNMATSIYDSILDVTDGWGSQTGTAGFPTTITMQNGTSKYTPGISIEGTTNNTGTSTTIYDSTKNFTNEGNAGNIAVGDILYNKDTLQYSKVLSFGTYTVVTDQSIWGSSGINYRVENSNAARGKIALINAGWFVNDGGAYIPPVTPLQLQFTVASNTQTQIDIPYVQGTSFTVDWGDGLTETSTGSNNRTLSHTYNDGNNNNVTNPTVSINAQGDLNPLTGFSFGQSGGGSKALLIDIPAWGNTPFTYVQSLLSGCNNLNTLSATDAPIITTSNFYNMLGSTGTLGNADLTSWDVSSATYTGYMFAGSLFNGNISNWDVSNVTNMSYMFNGAAFSGNISSWDVRNVTDAGRQFIGMSGNPDITGWFYESLTTAYFWAWSASNFNPGPFKIGATATNQNWKYMHNGTSWSTNNWTDFLVLNANAANARNPKTPTSALLAPGTNGKTFDTTRTYNTGFPNGGRAFSFLTADVTISGGSSAINGVYAYNYTTQKWVKDGDSEKTIEWNAEESVWEVLSAGVSQHVGSGGTQGNGPESSTSWTGGITVVDSSMGWSISNSLIT
jgi:surface protein